MSKPKLTAKQQSHATLLSARERAVEEMNELVVMIKTPTTVFDIADYSRMPQKDFSLWYANRLYWVEEKPHSSAQAWLQSTRRREFARLVYEPGGKHTDAEFNMFRGWGAESKPGDVGPWTRLLDHLYGKGTPERRFAEQWNGYPIRFPGTKLRTARLVWSVDHGVGKGAEATVLARIYGSHNVTLTVSDKELDAPFNTWQENKQLIVVPECLVSGDAKRNLANRMKDFITSPVVTINDKFKSTYEVPSCTNYLFHSNNPDAMKIEDRDRRYHIHEVRNRKPGEEFWKEFFAWAESDEGAGALRYHFENNVDYSGFNPYAAAPMTVSKADMIEGTATPLQNWARVLKSNPDSVVGNWTVATVTDLLELARRTFAEDAGTLRFLDSTRLGNALKSAGLRKLHPRDKAKGAGQIRLDGDKHTFWALRDVEKLERMTASELVALYKKERPPTLKGRRKF